MNPFLLQLLCLIQIVTFSLAIEPPSSNPNRTLDETTDPDHGRVISPSHAVLKLDCPGCPLYNSTWDDTATALIYDLRIINTTLTPSIHLNSGPFFPAGNKLGFTPITRHIALPVPYHINIDDYLVSPSQYANTEMAAIIEDDSVPNGHGWNITRIQCINFGYGEFENRGMNISMVNLYLLTPNETQALEIVWWEIENMAVAYSHNRTLPALPKKLENKLLHQDGRTGSRHGGIRLSKMLLIVGVVACVVTGTAAWVSTRYQHGSRKGIYRAVTLEEPLWEEEVEERELGSFSSMTA